MSMKSPQFTVRQRDIVKVMATVHQGSIFNTSKYFQTLDFDKIAINPQICHD